MPVFFNGIDFYDKRSSEGCEVREERRNEKRGEGVTERQMIMTIS